MRVRAYSLQVIHLSSTLFVSNLPYTATSTDLQTLFSDIGPVRSAFIVQDKETKVSKGVGYVSFAIRDDAQRALDDPTSLVLDGRSLRVQWPGQKVRMLAHCPMLTAVFRTKTSAQSPRKRRARPKPARAPRRTTRSRRAPSSSPVSPRTSPRRCCGRRFASRTAPRRSSTPSTAPLPTSVRALVLFALV